MIEKALGVIADDSLIVNCGEVDEEPDFIPEESGITVEAEVEGDSIEEPSTTPAGLEVSHQVLKLLDINLLFSSFYFLNFILLIGL